MENTAKVYGIETGDSMFLFKCPEKALAMVK